MRKIIINGMNIGTFILACGGSSEKQKITDTSKVEETHLGIQAASADSGNKNYYSMGRKFSAMMQMQNGRKAERIRKEKITAKL